MDSSNKYILVGKNNYIFIAPETYEVFQDTSRLILKGARVIAYPDGSVMQIRRLPNFGLNLEEVLYIDSPDWVSSSTDAALYAMHAPPKKPIGYKNA